MDFDIERREVELERVFVQFEDGEEEFHYSEVMAFLDAIKGTDGFVAGTRDPKHEDIAEFLEERGLVGKTHAAGWFEKDEEACEELYDRLKETYYDTLDDV